MNLEQLEERGFDNCSVDDESPGYIRVGCTRCAALSINGLPCHETGCPNKVTEGECFECGCPVLRKGSIFSRMLCEDCANPDPDLDPDNPDGEGA